MRSYTRVRSYPLDDSPDKADRHDKEDGKEDKMYRPAH